MYKNLMLKLWNIDNLILEIKHVRLYRDFVT